MSVSLRAYATHRRTAGLPGGTLRAVQQAIETGRVSVDADGQIPDAAAADAEWAQNTRENRRANGPQLNGTGHTAALSQAGNGAVRALSPLAEARLRTELARARTAELELGRLEGTLVELAPVREEVERRYRIVRTHLLAVPSKAAQRWPHGKPDLEVIALFNQLIHEALEELASGEPYRAARASATTEDKA